MKEVFRTITGMKRRDLGRFGWTQMKGVFRTIMRMKRRDLGKKSDYGHLYGLSVSSL